MLLQLLAANTLHQDQPENDRRYKNELLELMKRFGMPVQNKDGRLVTPSPFKPREYDPSRVDDSSPVIHVDHNNCILCDRCVRGCSEVKPFQIIGHTGFGNQARISFDLGAPMADSGCVSCGECAVSCPTGALTFKSSIYQERDPWRDETLKPTTVKAEALEKLPLFAGVPYAFLKWNEGAVGRLQAPAKMVLCKQHEYGSTAFIIESGTIDVVVGNQVVGGRDKSDVIVGELACSSHQARTASLIASEGGAEILVVKRNMLHMLQRNRGARNILAPIYRSASAGQLSAKRPAVRRARLRSEQGMYRVLEEQRGRGLYPGRSRTGGVPARPQGGQFLHYLPRPCERLGEKRAGTCDGARLHGTRSAIR